MFSNWNVNIFSDQGKDVAQSIKIVSNYIFIFSSCNLEM